MTERTGFTSFVPGSVLPASPGARQHRRLVVAALSTSAEGALVGSHERGVDSGAVLLHRLGRDVADGDSRTTARVLAQQPQPLGTGQVGNAATAVVWDGLRQRFYAAQCGCTSFYESSDGATWTRMVNQPGGWR